MCEGDENRCYNGWGQTGVWQVNDRGQLEKYSKK